ncbi:hypothetical protein MYAM1_000570 [Malassezia yamatoensis]|uniref:Nucleolar 27S pre-rRNA processing Urb2/Npa2 C-terminal domain-containing protein n=1 Tax=Malassezia yamatoensis TaxID=253288 RepID=A0AAJ5YRF2_9BASI|nr:hypothetical protein MYAM1_000570 [Malassezia yamatoensis]
MAQALAAWGVTTSETLIQALKRPDTSENGASDRFDVLREAWYDETMYIPQKRELLLDATLEILSNSRKAKKGHQNLLDPRYWGFLQLLLHDEPYELLHSLAGKYPFLQLASSVFENFDPELWKAMTPVIAQLLRANIRRYGTMQIDAVNAVFVDLFRVIPHIHGEQSLSDTCEVIEAMLEYWRPALALGTNAKKTCKLFLGSSLDAFAAAYTHLQDTAADHLRALLSEVLELALFNTNLISSSKAEDSLVEMLKQLADQLIEQSRAKLMILAAAPCFIEQFVHTAREINDTSVLTNSMRKGVLETFLIPICSELHAKSLSEKYTSTIARIRFALVALIDELGLWQPSSDEDSWKTLWNQFCSDTLANMRYGSDIATCYATLATLCHTNCDCLYPQHVEILAATMHPSLEGQKAAKKLLEHVFTHYAQQRELLSLMSKLCMAFAYLPSAEIEPDYVCQSPLFSRDTIRFLSDCLRESTSHDQVQPLLMNLMHSTEQCEDSSMALFQCTYQLLIIAAKNVGLAQEKHLQPTLQSLVEFAERYIRRGLRDSYSRPMLASALRLRYVVISRAIRHALADDIPPAAYVFQCQYDQLSQCFSDVHPEVVFESFQAILSAIEISSIYKVNDNLVRTEFKTFVESRLLEIFRRTDCECPSWDGQVFGLPAACLPIALWRQLTIRWASVLDEACPDTIGILASYLQSSLQVNQPGNISAMQNELSRIALRNDGFLELPEWRSALVKGVMDFFDRSDLGKPPTTLISKAQAIQYRGIATMLTIVPLSYIPRETVGQLYSHFAWLDAAWTLQGESVPWTAVKQLLHSLANLQETLPEVVPVASYIEATANLSTDDTTFIEISMQFLCCLLSKQKIEAHQVATVIASSSFTTKMGQQMYATIAEWFSSLNPVPLSAQECLQLTRKFPQPKYKDNRDSVAMSSFQLELRVYTALVHLREKLQLETEQFTREYSNLLVSVRKFCKETVSEHSLSQSTALSGQSMLVALITLSPRLNLHNSLIGISMVCATFCASLPDYAKSHFLPQLVAMSVLSSTDAYAETLETLQLRFTEYDTKGSHDAYGNQNRSALLTVIATLLRHGPSGTSRVASANFSSILVQLPLALQKTPFLAASAVELLENVCNHRALILRSVDVPQMLALISLLIGPSGRDFQHRQRQDASTIFLGIVSTLRAVIRLRKDILGNYLSQLTAVLCQLIPLLESLTRSNIGTSQLRKLAEATPTWLNIVEHPLGATEAQGLSRVYSEISTKSTSLSTLVAHKRKRTESNDHRNTSESLAHSMSKHVVYILMAYVRTVSQGTTTLAPPVRQELQAGLFALCDLVGHYERDAVMKGMLDASSQMNFKSLWSEWERQRYKGS